MSIIKTLYHISLTATYVGAAVIVWAVIASVVRDAIRQRFGI